MKKVVVLGGTGFHGSHVVRIAKEKSYEVYSISRREGVDIRDYPKFAARLKEIQPDAIIDCAGHEGSVHYVNQHAAEVAHDTFQMALNIYRAVAEVCPQAVVINALGNCSYPGDATVAKESEWLSGPVHESVLSSGTQIREWVYIGDAANMLVESVEMKEQIYPINFAQKKGYAIKEIAALAARELDYPVEFIFDITKADGAPIKILDDAEFRKYYPGFKFTPIETGIKETIRYYKKIL